MEAARAPWREGRPKAAIFLFLPRTSGLLRTIENSTSALAVKRQVATVEYEFVGLPAPFRARIGFNQEDNEMAKEQRRGSKEVRKPKKVVEKAVVAAPSLKGGLTPPAARPAKAK
ncbi:hypothetical protein [Aureimonas populi]|uniref:Uncharacterized protein n=1 Tax=Aureimonas populi TaxID=1701758 RepID=A0ABW5CK62_9HYPH|nr:hypothetical protein [Aureimonas populi]